MNKMYSYIACGMRILSEIPMENELLSCENLERIDVSIICGKIPGNLRAEECKQGEIIIGDNEAFFVNKKIGKFYIANGNLVIIEPFDGAEHWRIVRSIINTVFGIILVQKNYLAIHGGAVCINNNGLVITGTSGAGKSSLINYLGEKGGGFLSDEICRIDSDKDKSIIYPSYPQQRLCEDIAIKKGYNLNELRCVSIPRKKYALNVENQYNKNSIQLKAICKIRKDNVKKIEIEEVLGLEKLDIIKRSLYMKSFREESGNIQKNFEDIINLASNISIYIMRRPYDGYTIEEQYKVIRELIG